MHPFVPLAAACGVFFAFLARDVRFLIPAWFALFALLFRADRIRYLLPLFPLLALMAGYGMRMLFRDERAGRFAALSAVTTAIVLSVAAYLPFLNSTSMVNLKDAGSFIDSLPGDGVIVAAVPQKHSLGNTELAVPLLDLYTQKKVYFSRTAVTRPDAGALSVSPLRFTWEISLPVFYDPPGRSSPRPGVIISSGVIPLADRAGARAFTSDSGTFRYRTWVTVVPAPVLADSAH
jgi:hypothetical protein